MRAFHIALALVCLSEGMVSAQPTTTSTTGTTSTTSTTSISEQIAEAQRLFEAGRTPRAKVLFEEALRQAEQQQLVDEQGWALLGLARATIDVDRRTEANAMFERALALFTQSGNRLGRARTLAASGASLWTRGERDEARRRVLEACEILRALDATDALAEAYIARLTVTESGPEMDRFREEALATARASNVPELACSVLISWGNDLYQEGDLGRGYRLFADAVRCYEALPVARQTRMWRAYLSVGDAERTHGQFDAALASYQRALAVARRIENPWAIMVCLNAVGVGHRALRQMDEARAAYEEALAAARALPARTYTPYLLGQLGGHLMDEERFQEALPLLTESLNATRDARLQIERLTQVGHCHARLGRFREAREATDRAVTLARTTGPVYLMNAYRWRAETRRLDGDITGATADLRDGIDIAENLRAKTAPIDFMKRGFSEWHQWLFGSSIALLTQQGRVRDALETAERARARAFLDLLATREAAGVTPAGDASVPAPASTPSHIANTQAVAAAAVPEMIAAARRLRSTLLMYWVDLDTTYVWVVTPAGRVHVEQVRVARDRLDALAASTRVAASRIDDGMGLLTLSRPAALQPWRELHDLLIKPVRAHLPRTPNALLTIVPHGPLFQLSFAALRDERGQYLLERYRLHYTPAVGVLAYTARARQARASHPSGGALLVGDPGELPRDAAATGNGAAAAPTLAAAAAGLRGGPGESRNSLAPLPWARREVAEVAALLGADAARGTTSPMVLIDAQATESEVRANLRGRSILHFATHAVVRQDSDSPLASFLALRSDGSATPTAATDGHLTASEVYGLQLDASLVVLSACSSALGRLTGDGVIGFTRAFLYAGAASVIATEWDVPDTAGYELMRRFYQSRRATPDPSRALRAAQISTLTALRRGTITVSTPGGGPVALPEHPLFWAGFILVGEP